MKITKSELRQIIKEELGKVLSEAGSSWDPLQKALRQKLDTEKKSRQRRYQVDPGDRRRHPTWRQETVPEVTPQDIKAGEELSKSAEGQEIFAKLENDPNVQAALQRLMTDPEVAKITQQLQESEYAENPEKVHTSSDFDEPEELAGVDWKAAATILGVPGMLPAHAIMTSILSTTAGEALLSALTGLLPTMGLGLSVNPVMVGAGLLATYLFKKSFEDPGAGIGADSIKYHGGFV